jgi:hypothetical protein
MPDSSASGGRRRELGRVWPSTQHLTGFTMGDKSPKAKEKSKKQDTVDKNQKKAQANAKAAAQSANAAKKK